MTKEEKEILRDEARKRSALFLKFLLKTFGTNYTDKEVKALQKIANSFSKF